MQKAGVDSDRGTSGFRTIAGSLPRLSILLPAGLLSAAFLFGGSSAGQPLRDMIVQLAGVMVLAAVAMGWIGRAWSEDARLPLLLLAALTGLLLFQLIPLPFGLWSALGGRDLSVAVIDLIGAEHGARPLSLQPERTVLSALALIPGVAMTAAVMRLDTPSRMVLAWGVVVAALASLLLGVVQSSVGGMASHQFTLYATSHAGQPLGVFANTNHQADLLLAGFVIAGSLAPPLTFARTDRSARPYWIYGIMVALAIGVVASGSRTGIALLAVAFAGLLVRERLTGHVRLFLLGALLLAVSLVLLILFNPIFARSFADFSNIDDPRFNFWPNVYWAIGHFGWLGTGAGTFDGVYRSAETLDTLTASFVNHAHNDYLEILLETGVAGAILFLAFLAFVVWRGVSIIRRAEARVGRALAYGGMICLGLLLLHSAVDYPLRTPLLGVLFGLFVGLMTRSPPAIGTDRANQGRQLQSIPNGTPDMVGAA